MTAENKSKKAKELKDGENINSRRKQEKGDEIRGVEPIRSLEELERMKSALKDISYRDYMIFLFGINTGLRVGDILELTAGEVRGKEVVRIRERKTGKVREIDIYNGFYTELNEYCRNISDDMPLFPSRRNKKVAVDSVRYYRVMIKAGEQAGIKSKIGTHSMRKSWGYHFYKQTKDVAMVQEILNHATQDVTRRYIGISRDEIKREMKKFSL